MFGFTKKSISVSVVAVSLKNTSGAFAKPSGLALGLERAFGFVSSSHSVEAGGVTATTTQTRFSLGLAGAETPFSRARVGIDYIMHSGLSLGMGFGFSTGSSSVEFDGASGGGDGPDTSGLLLTPRVGYLMMLFDEFGFWPRAGLSYASLGGEGAAIDPNTGAPLFGELSTTDIAFTAEVPVVVLTSRDFGFFLAPSFDMSLSHSEEVDGTEIDGDQSFRELGIHFGIFGVL